MFKCNGYLYNITMGNKTDVNGYVCPVVIVGIMAANGGNATFTIRNVFAFNNQYGANTIVNNNSNGSWPGTDTANDIYATAAQALSYLQDTNSVFMPTSTSYLNTHGVSVTTPFNSVPDIYGYSGAGNRIGAVFYNPGGTPPPTCNAGSNQNVTLPTNLTLNGSGSTGTITSYAWTTASGPNSPTFTTPTLSTTGVTGEIPGTYQFTLTLNSTTSCNTQVVVNAHTPPLVVAGGNQTITLPINITNISGSATTYQGTTVASYLWTKIGGTGTSYTITSPSSNSTSITNLGAGTFFFNY